MANFPYYPSAGAAAIAGYAPTVYAGGVTVFEPASTAYRNQHKLATRGLASHTMYQSLTAYQLILNIKVAVGAIPANVTVIGFLVKSSDMDSGSAALVQSLYIGSTEVATGITTGQAGTSAFIPCLPTATTAETAVYINTTTAAATPTAGTVYVTAVYYST